MINLTQIIALFFGLLVISKTLIDYKSKKEGWPVFLFWLTLWLAVIYVAFDPMIINRLVRHFDNQNFTVGQIVGMGFIFTLYIVYRVYVKTHRLEKQINYLIREIALKDLKKKKKR